MLGLTSSGFAVWELELIRQFQKLAFSVLEDVARGLQAGMTEKDVARRIRKQLRVSGAQDFFHVPVALFGERTAYPGNFGQLGALPTERMLQSGDAVILDAAPIFDGWMVDVSYSLRFGGGAVPLELDRALAGLRDLVLEGARKGETMQVIALEVDMAITSAGFENCHRKHIGKVLGHRIICDQSELLRDWSVWGISVRHAAWFFLTSWRSMRGKPQLSPNWNHLRQSDCPVPDGLWAIEPHIASKGYGAKFEEILVVQDGHAFYLDDQLPHMRRWRAAGIEPADRERRRDAHPERRHSAPY